MGGFVSFSDDRAWAMNNAVWRAVIHPVRDVLLEGSEPRLILEHAIRPGIHYLDLGGRLPSDVATIRDAIAQSAAATPPASCDGARKRRRSASWSLWTRC